MWWKRAFLIFGALIALVATSDGQPEPKKEISEKTATEIYKVFSAREMWERGFGSNAKYLASWSKIDQTSVTVFRDKIVGNRPYKKSEDAEEAAAKLRKALLDSKPDFTPKFSELFYPEKHRSPAENVVVIEFFGDDDSTRLAWNAPEGSTFPKDLTISAIHDRLGKPERVTTMVLPREEGRPVVLTLHHYAEDSVIYAESNLAAKPGRVNRVILNIPTLSKVMFKEK
jgi:hypothetical protein